MNTTAPRTLDRAAISERIPHSGSMCLLDRLDDWSEERILCSAISHRDLHNPLRSARGLLAPAAIEYAAQAMALHGALLGHPAAPPLPGYLASVRAVRFVVLRLDDIAGRLQVSAERLAGDAKQILYRFAVSSEQGALLAEGRATVVLDTVL